MNPFQWQVQSPGELGLDPLAVAEHQTLCENTGADACLVVSQGRIAAEWYSPRLKKPMYAMSCTKSVTSLLVGILLDEGRIKSLDTPVGAYIQSWNDASRAKVSIRHLLTHTSGLRQRPGKNSVGMVADKNAHVIAMKPEHEAGARFEYSNEGVQLLSPILDQAAGEPIQDFAKRRLFTPLGMSETRLMVDAKQHAWTYADMKTTPRDFARLGVLMLQGGKWEDKQIISEEYIRQATQPSGAQPSNGLRGHGLLWWTYGGKRTLTGYAAHGYLDTNLYIFPDHDIVVTRMQSPRAEFTGAPESAGYAGRALALFKRFPAAETKVGRPIQEFSSYT
jgi:CubicO group peptidase (beta-lactamase class C family)